jgi:ribosomal protein S1
MGKTVTVSIPSWVDEDEFRRIVDKVVKSLEGRVPVEELRRRLGVRPEDLVEDLDAVDVEALEARERERLSL